MYLGGWQEADFVGLEIFKDVFTHSRFGWASRSPASMPSCAANCACDRLHEELKKTFIYVTHDQEEAMTLADRIIVMRSGVIEQMGSPMEIYSNPVSYFVADFFGSPSMNLIPEELVRGDGGIDGGAGNEGRSGSAGNPAGRS